MAWMASWCSSRNRLAIAKTTFRAPVFRRQLIFCCNATISCVSSILQSSIFGGHFNCLRPHSASGIALMQAWVPRLSLRLPLLCIRTEPRRESRSGGFGGRFCLASHATDCFEGPGRGVGDDLAGLACDCFSDAFARRTGLAGSGLYLSVATAFSETRLTSSRLPSSRKMKKPGKLGSDSMLFT